MKQILKILIISGMFFLPLISVNAENEDVIVKGYVVVVLSKGVVENYAQILYIEHYYSTKVLYIYKQLRAQYFFIPTQINDNILIKDNQLNSEQLVNLEHHLYRFRKLIAGEFLYSIDNSNECFKFIPKESIIDTLFKDNLNYTCSHRSMNYILENVSSYFELPSNKDLLFKAVHATFNSKRIKVADLKQRTRSLQFGSDENICENAYYLFDGFDFIPMITNDSLKVWYPSIESIVNRPEYSEDEDE